LKGHGFSCAVEFCKEAWALAPEGSLQTLLLALILPLQAVTVSAQAPTHPPTTLRIAAAADLQPLLPALLTQFQQQTGIHAEPSFQSSATLATQIIDGAPFDLFLAADLSFPQRVIDAGRAEEAQPIPYARGTLVLWTRNDSGLATLSLDDLRNPSVKTIAIANPEHAPYGRAAQAVLQHTGLYDILRPKLVIAENIAQAAQYVDSGNAQAGLISLTSALTLRLRASGHFFRVPDDDYPPILQGAIVIRGSAASAAAHRFLDFLAEPAIRQMLSAEGLEPAR
jgi:molybdate transport system substrate-binding protein